MHKHKTLIFSSVIKKNYFIAISIILFWHKIAYTQTTTFNYTGGMQTYTVPACVSSITITAFGAQGQSGIGGNFGAGGLGGITQGVLAVVTGQVYNIFVGGQTGYNGGGIPGTGIPNTSGFGGGASDVRFGGVALANRIIVGAGGGGGAGGPQVSCSAGLGGKGGVGGNLIGGNGTQATGCGLGGNFGAGGTQVAGGTGGLGNFNCSVGAGNGIVGALGIGGNGGNGIIGCACYTGSGGGGGGGGYYGGGGGGGGVGGCGGSFAGGGGGGGSSWAGALASPLYTLGLQAGNGKVIINDNCASLPIKLLNFNVEYEKVTGNAYLFWSTASEKNNKLFTVEKSINAIDWNPVSNISGAGNSSKTLHYALTDEKPFNGISYYRLKQTDYDGYFMFSDLAQLNIEEDYSVTIFPNPSNGNVTLKYTSRNIDVVNVRITEVSGKEVVTYEMNHPQEGINDFDINTSILAPGMYFIQVNNQQKTFYLKFVKL